MRRSASTCTRFSVSIERAGQQAVPSLSAGSDPRFI
jgi:hypothetical protein